MAGDQALYDALAACAQGWVTSTMPKTPHTNDLNVDNILSYLSPSAQISWGHTTFVSSKPGLQGTKSPNEFIQHLTSMSPNLATWRIELTDVVVDVRKKSAVVRADFHMLVKGEGVEPVLNDILFWVGMEETEEGVKVIKSIEFIDPTAGAELGKTMMKSSGVDGPVPKAVRKEE